MFDIVAEKIKDLIRTRMLPVVIIYVMLTTAIVSRLFYLQIVKGDSYSSTFQASTKAERDISATRGNIYDANGNLLAYNKLSYSVTLLDEGAFDSYEELNAMIYKTIQIIESNGNELELTFGLIMEDDGTISFRGEGSTVLRFKRDVYGKSKVSDLSEEQENATAEEVFEFLRSSKEAGSPKFLISDEYTKEEAFKIMTVRYAMYLNTSTKYELITLASDVDEKTVAAIKENAADLPGVDITEHTIRAYNYGESMAHIVGYTGTISDEKWSEMEESGEDEIYTKSDQIGKDGLEKEFESYLRGQKGYDTVTLNESKRIENVIAGTDPVAGNDLYLTIDAELQEATYQLLEKKLASILLENIVNSKVNTTTSNGKKNIKISIYEVYNSLLENGTIRISRFDDEDATELEQSVYNKYKSEYTSVISRLKNTLAYNSTILNSSLSDEMADYVDYIYSVLTSKDILITNNIDSTDEMYIKYQEDEISLSEFLRYAIGQPDWINSNLFIEDRYYESEEIYNELINYVEGLLQSDTSFTKMIYKNLIYSQKLSGKEICLLLFDQGVLKYDKEAVQNLQSGNVSAYSFIRAKIRNLEITPAQLALDPCSGSVIITDVNTGKVKAMVSYPSYDSNRLANKVDSEYFTYLMTNSSRPMFLRATKQKTAPGSTYKMLTSIAGIGESAISVSEKILDKVVFDEITPSAKCWFAPHSHGKVDVAHALEVSCNYFFYEVGYRLSLENGRSYNSNLGLKKLEKYAKMFGFGEKSGIELPEYISEISDESSVRSAIGQGTNNFTASSLAKYVTAIANSGTSYNLSLVDKVADIDGNTVMKKDVEVYNNIDSITDSTWNAVHYGMNLVVNGSNSSISNYFKNIGVTVAGKTGTAQQETYRPDHALFVSYAPYDTPEVSVTTVIPYGYTSSNAAELTSKIYNYYFNESEREEILNEGVSTQKQTNQTVD